MAEFTEVMKQKKRMCNQFPRKDEFLCDYCPIDSDNNGHHIDCSSFILKYPQEAESKIMKWAEEHPAQTNADKFKETFGLEVNDFKCPFIGTYVCEENKTCCDCELDGFWHQEYKEPKEVE